MVFGCGSCGCVAFQEGDGSVMGFSLSVPAVKTHQHSSAVGDGGKLLAQHYVYAPDKSQLLLFRDSALTQGASLFVIGAYGEPYLVGNGYFDGGSWLRNNTLYPLYALGLDTYSDVLSLYRAAAGANPASPTEIFRIRSDGRIVLPVFHPIFSLLSVI